MRKQGFTLVELLVVMAIIGILAGLMFPALGAIRKRAYSTQTHELLVQVQSAWTLHFNDFRSFPDKSLFDDATDSNGDMSIPMTPYNTCLLNWRTLKPTKFSGKNEKWQKLMASQIRDAVSDSEDNKPHGLSIEDGKDSYSVSTRDAYFEINQMQWLCGILNIWGERRAMKLYKSGGGTAAKDAASQLVKENFADPMVYARLDMNYDGKVDAPVKTTSSTADFLNKIAVAWVCGESPKDDAIVSW